MESRLEPQCGLGSHGDGQKPESVLVNSKLRGVGVPCHRAKHARTHLAPESEMLKEDPGGGGAGAAASWATGEPADSPPHL